MKLSKYMGDKNNIANIELFSAGRCNLSCVYCYITKDQKMLKHYHSKILEAIRSGKYLKLIEENIGFEKLKSISHWGTEPTLTIVEFKDFYNELISKCPNFKTISFSTNMIQPPKKMIQFIENLPTKKLLNINIQMSLDGPKWMTDYNRNMKNATELIVDHAIEFFKKINESDIKHKISMHFKPTMSYDRDMPRLTDINELREYYRFFDDVFDKLVKVNFNKKIYINFSANPTLVIPGDCTKQDGINFYNICRNQDILREEGGWKYVVPMSDYIRRFSNTCQKLENLYVKPYVFSCSAGDSSFGLGPDGDLHACHRTYYSDYPEFSEAMKERTDRDKHDKRLLNKGNMKILPELIMYDKNEEHKINTLMRFRSFHDFMSYKLSFITSYAMEMAHSGQISSCYKSKNNAYLLAINMVGITCPLEDILENGSMSLASISFLRLFGNGAFELICKHLRNKDLKYDI